MENFKKFSYVPTQVYIGDCIDFITVLVNKQKFRRVAIITGKKSMIRKAYEIKDKLSSMENVIAEIFRGVPSHPDDEYLSKLKPHVRSFNPDLLVSIGGGSVIDVTKLLSLIVNEEDEFNLCQLITQQGENTHNLPHLAIPTTTGSGSEVTPYASITFKCNGNRKKISVTDKKLFPLFSILDKNLVANLPLNITAISGFDALTHAIEGYWSRFSTEYTDALALMAIKGIIENMEKIFIEDARKIKGNLLVFSNLAGHVIAITKTTAVHAASYPLSVLYNVPHGMACSLILPEVIKFNQRYIPEGKIKNLLEYLKLSDFGGFVEKIENLRRLLKLPSRLRDLGIKEKDLVNLLSYGLREDRIIGNPRPFTLADYESILRKIL